MKEVEVVCAIIKNEKNQYFCCRRGPDHSMEGFWEFPGGKVEPHETHQETVVRELKEELNTIVKPVKYIMTLTYNYPSMGGYEAFKLTMHAYLCINVKAKTFGLGFSARQNSH